MGKCIHLLFARAFRIPTSTLPICYQCRPVTGLLLLNKQVARISPRQRHNYSTIAMSSEFLFEWDFYPLNSLKRFNHVGICMSINHSYFGARSFNNHLAQRIGLLRYLNQPTPTEKFTILQCSIVDYLLLLERSNFSPLRDTT